MSHIPHCWKSHVAAQIILFKNNAIVGFGLLLPEYEDLGPELQCLLKVKDDLLSLLIFQDAKNDVLN